MTEPSASALANGACVELEARRRVAATTGAHQGGSNKYPNPCEHKLNKGQSILRQRINPFGSVKLKERRRKSKLKARRCTGQVGSASVNRPFQARLQTGQLGSASPHISSVKLASAQVKVGSTSKTPLGSSIAPCARSRGMVDLKP